MSVVGGHRRRARAACCALLLLIVASILTPSTVAGSASAAGVPRALRDAPDRKEPDPPTRTDRPGAGVVHLTFDDGPSDRHTGPILDLLARYDAKATFFVVGANAVDRPDLVRSIVDGGHALGNHTWSHRDMRRLNGRQLRHQITKTSEVLGAIGGRPITCLRPPFGALNGRAHAAIRREDLALKRWDVDPRDWRRPGTATIARRVIARTGPGAVVLLHDGGGNRSQSVAALERILPALAEQGYEFATLPGC